MSTRTIVILVLVGLVLAYFLAPSASAAEQAAPSSTPTPPQDGTAKAVSDVTDLLKGPVTTFFGPGGILTTQPAPSAGVPAIAPSSPYAGPVSGGAPAVASAQQATAQAAAYQSMPGTDLRAGILRGWGRKWVNGIFYTYSAASLTQQRLQNLTPGAGGGLWNYTGTALQPQPTVPEWNAFDAARRSLLGL
jgi:hypothetical protein